MAVNLENPPQQIAERPPRTPAPPIRSSRWAWLAILSAPVFAVLAIWMSFFVLGDENIKWWGDLIVLLLVFGPPLVGAVLGARSARSGSLPGVHAAALASSWVAFVIMFWLMANYPYNGESGVMPMSLGVISGVVLAAAVEGWYWLRTHRPRGA